MEPSSGSPRRSGEPDPWPSDPCGHRHPGKRVAHRCSGIARQSSASLCRDEEDLAAFAIDILRAYPAAERSAAGLDRVAAHCSAVLEARLARPPRAPGDWSIQLPAGCGCDLCAELRAFLADPDRTGHDWPLAKDRRAHIHGRIDTAELPVTHQTRRSGRPYTLVLDQNRRPVRTRPQAACPRPGRRRLARTPPGPSALA